MNDLERLVALEDIKVLRAKYCMYIDTHAWRSLENILTADAILDMSGTGEALGQTVEPIHGREQIITTMETGFSNLKMLLHIVTIPIIEFVNEKRATGIWRQETYVKEGRPDLPGCGIAYATVNDTYVKEDDGWRIQIVKVKLDLVM